MNVVLEKAVSVETDKPDDFIIRQIRSMINSGALKPGDRLPAERKIAEQFGIGRTHVRKAIKKLEFYGILKTLPQSGSVITGLEISAIDGLITDVLKLGSFDFFSLVEMRVILEKEAVRLCTRRHTSEDMKEIESMLQAYLLVQDDPTLSVEKDFMFHRKIAEASHNMVLKSMLLIITPDIMTIYNRQRVCDKLHSKAPEEHQLLCKYIREHNEEKAIALIEQHLQGVVQFSQSSKIF